MRACLRHAGDHRRGYGLERRVGRRVSIPRACVSSLGTSLKHWIASAGRASLQRLGLKRGRWKSMRFVSSTMAASARDSEVGESRPTIWRPTPWWSSLQSTLRQAGRYRNGRKLVLNTAWPRGVTASLSIFVGPSRPRATPCRRGRRDQEIVVLVAPVESTIQLIAENSKSRARTAAPAAFSPALDLCCDIRIHFPMRFPPLAVDRGESGELKPGSAPARRYPPASLGSCSSMITPFACRRSTAARTLCATSTRRIQPAAGAGIPRRRRCCAKRARGGGAPAGKRCDHRRAGS